MKSAGGVRQGRCFIQASHLSPLALASQNRRLRIQETEVSEESLFWNSGDKAIIAHEMSAMWPYLWGQTWALGKNLCFVRRLKESTLGVARFF